MKTDLSLYDNSWYHIGAGNFKNILWYFCNILFVKCSLQPLSVIKVRLLRLFGAKIGKGVVIKPGVNIKYPWNLSIGDYSWIGENVWIDNLAKVKIGNNVCDLMVKPIVIEDGAWVGAQSTVCPGVTMHLHSVLAVGSIASKDLMPYSIYRGNPAVKVAERVMFES